MKKLIVLLVLQLLSFSSYASYFEQINHYQDRDCPSWNIERFRDVRDWITLGVNDSRARGFDFEVPISRKGVDVIWCALVPKRASLNDTCKGIINFNNSKRPFSQYAGRPVLNTVKSFFFMDLEDQYNAYFKYVKEIAIREHESRPNVGYVLELLARYYFQDLTAMYPKNVYTIGSGVAYYEKKGTNTIGELDIIIYDRQTCSVEVVGEAKASYVGNQRRSLNKAKSQLKRFKDFLRYH